MSREISQFPKTFCKTEKLFSFQRGATLSARSPRMNRHRRILMTIRIVVILLVGLAFLIARFAKGQQPSAAEIAKKETVASAFTRGFGYQEYQVRSAAEAMPEDKYG